MEFKEKEALVYYLSSNVVEETPIMFDNIYNEFLSTHLTLRLYHPIEMMCEETNDGMGKYILSCFYWLVNSQS